MRCEASIKLSLMQQLDAHSGRKSLAYEGWEHTCSKAQTRGRSGSQVQCSPSLSMPAFSPLRFHPRDHRPLNTEEDTRLRTSHRKPQPVVMSGGRFARVKIYDLPPKP